MHRLESRPRLLRAILVLLILGVELIWGINNFAAPRVTGDSGLFSSLLESAEQIFKGVVAFAGAYLLVLSRQFRIFADGLARQSLARFASWVVVHFFALILFVHLTRPIFAAGESVNPSVISLGLWLAAGLTTLASLLFAVIPPSAWIKAMQGEKLGLMVSALAGTIAWFAGNVTQQIWYPLASWTFGLSRWVLSGVYRQVHVEPERMILGTDRFVVGIAPSCSGYEGIGLVIVFLAVYLWAFREELAFPRALLLFPVGIVAIWLANVARIAILIIIGSEISPEIAVDGFHSQAGWIGFCLVALGLIALSHRSSFSLRSAETWPSTSPQPSMAASALLVPMLALLATTILVRALSSGFSSLYPLGVIVTAALLWRYRESYRSLKCSFSWQPVGIGLIVFLIWMALQPADVAAGVKLAIALNGLPGWLATVWILFKVVGSTITVPIAEELAFRGYVLRKLISTDFESVPAGQFRWGSFLGSSAIFGLLHGNWIAGSLAGAGFALALYRRGQIADAMVAHITCNALIAASVLLAGRWSLWV